MVAPPNSGYSARVRLELVIGEVRIPLAQAGGGRLMFGQEIVLPGTTGEVICHVDDRERRWRVTWEATSLPQRTVMAEFRDVEYSPVSDATTTA
jgi:hypothetical protein